MMRVIDQQWLLLLAITYTIDCSTGISVTSDENSNIEYFESVDLDCTHLKWQSNRMVQSVHFWILPSGEVIKPNDGRQSKHVLLKDNGFVLSINKLDDGDFGKYFCIVKIGDNETDVIERNVNIDGPYYGPEYGNRIRKNAIVGGIAAAVMLVALVTVWLVCVNCKCCNATKQHKDVENVAEKSKKEHSALPMTTIGDSIYYTADNVHVHTSEPYQKQVVLPSISNDLGHDDRLLSSESAGHYISIGSLERNMKPFSEHNTYENDGLLNPGFDDNLRVVSPEQIHSNNVRLVHSISSSKEIEPSKEEADSVFEMSVQEENENVSLVEEGIATPIEEPVYATPSPRNNRSPKEAVTIVEGDVIIESTGASVSVTTSSTASQKNEVTTSYATLPPKVANPLEIVKDKNDTEGFDQSSVLTATAPLDDCQPDGKVSEAVQAKTTKSSVGGEEVPVAATSDSGGSSPKSVDEETINNFHNVLSNLMSNHRKKNMEQKEMSAQSSAHVSEGNGSSSNEEDVHL